MKKIYLFILPALFSAMSSFAQPGAVGNNNISGAPFVCTPLTAPSGFFFQARVLANQSSSSATWEFPQNCSYPGDVWRPYFGSGVTFNSTVAPAPGPGNGALYNSGNGGASGTLPATTNGNYYTFNIQNVSAPANAYMAVLETSYNPVTISAVSNTSPANASNSVLVTCTASAAPSAGEYVYVRYSTDGYVTSAITQFNFTGTTGQALIPCFAGGTVVNYYVMSSNRTAAQIAADVLATGSQVSYDMLTLSLNNNGGPNYSYTQGSATNFGGIYSTPSSCYATVSAFVTALNAGTVTAPVTMYAIGGSATETATIGGIDITKTGTLANPIVIQKFGTGNYTIQASAALTVGNVNDAIIKITGADYVTIDGLTLQENAANTINATAATNNMTEWGIALLRASTTDGAQNNTIQNNTISLDRTYRNTFGIYSNARHTAIDPLTANDATAATGSNSGNKVYANNISNVMMGITFIGTATAAFQDAGNDIGGSSASTGNTITNWGGNSQLSAYASNTATAVSYGIYSNHQTADNISYNTLNSGTVGAGVSATVFAGIRKEYTVTAPTGTFTSTISYNTITMSSAFTSGNFECIRSQGMTTLSTATINITNNNIVNTAIASGSTSAFGGIINGSAPGTLNITNNIIRGHTTASSGGYTGISNGGAVVNAINITNNKLGDAVAGALTQTTATGSQMNCITNSGGASTATLNITGNSFDGFAVVSYNQTAFVLNTAGVGTVNMNNNLLGSATGSLITYSGTMTGNFFGIYTQGSPVGASTSIQNNDIRGIVHSVTGTGGIFLLNNVSPVLSQTISNNTFTNLSLNTSNLIFFMQQNGAMVSGASFTCNNNSIVTAFSKTASGGQVEFLHSTAASATGSTVTETGNNFSNVTLTGNPPLFGWNESSGASATAGPTKTITGNTFNNITMGTGLAAVIYLWKGTNVHCSSNTVSNISGPTVYGIINETTGTAGTWTFASNNIFNLTSTGDITAMVGGTGVTSTNINNNTIYNLASSGASAIVAGIDASAITANISDNLIYGLSVSGTTSPSVNGILIKGGTTVNVFRNRIYDITASGAVSTTSPAVNGMVFSGGTTVTAYNNFIADLKAPNANLTDAVRGIAVTSATASTNYNLYYNSIYLNAASTGTNFGTSAIYHAANATTTTATLRLNNNIFVNTSTANGAGVTAAYRRSNTNLFNFSSISDYNLYYAGTPSASRLIYYDGTNSDQTLAAYQTRVSIIDANSISLMPAFTSVTDLHLTSANCGIDGRGIPVGAVTTDIDGASRDASTPDIGADEFTASYSTTTLAGIAGSAVCDSKNVSASPTVTTYATSNCDLIAQVVASGADPVGGRINVCVTRDASQLYFNGEPYVQRHYDLEPAVSNQTTTSATITMYFTDAEFVLYNTNNPAWPPLPTVASGGLTSAYIGNVKVTQFHGTPTGGLPTSTPGNYTGTRVVFNTPTLGLNGSIWSVTINVSGFSGFYVHTNNFNAPLPIVVNYLTGRRQGSNHLLNWKVTCNSTPRVMMTLERSSDGRNYAGINTITADAARCQQPFDHTDTDPLKGMNYYRLKIVDADGKVTYSTTVALLNAVKGFDIISIVPNPVVDNNFKLNVASAQAGKMEISIFDMQGRLMNRQSIFLTAGFNSVPVGISNLSAGTYSVRGTMPDGQSKVIRFVKQVFK